MYAYIHEFVLLLSFQIHHLFIWTIFHMHIQRSCLLHMIYGLQNVFICTHIYLINGMIRCQIDTNMKPIWYNYGTKIIPKSYQNHTNIIQLITYAFILWFIHVPSHFCPSSCFHRWNHPCIWKSYSVIHFIWFMAWIGVDWNRCRSIGVSHSIMKTNECLWLYCVEAMYIDSSYR